MSVTLASVLTCPVCGNAETLAMPTDACMFFHECAGCRTVLRPKAGDCCVFCSYGSVACPPIQAGDATAGGCGASDGESTTGCCGAARPVAADVRG